MAEFEALDTDQERTIIDSIIDHTDLVVQKFNVEIEAEESIDQQSTKTGDLTERES